MPFFNKARAMAKYTDLSVYVLMPEYPRYALLQPRRFGHRAGDAPLDLGHAPVEYVRYPALPVLTRLSNGWQCGRRLRPRLEAFRPDVVLSYQLYPEAFGAVAAARALGVPCIVGAIGSDLRCCGAILRPFVRKTMSDASAVVTVCDELTNRAVEMGIPRSKVTTIANGCDRQVFYPRSQPESRAALGIPPDTKLVVFTGNLVEVKGLPHLIDAIARLKARGESVDAALIGAGPLKSRLRELARKLGVDDRIRFLGSKPPFEVARWLAAADLFCLPSYSEGSPNVVIEALCCGRPVVASAVGGIPELIDPQCGLLVPPADSVGLANAVSTALRRDWNESYISWQFGRDWDDMARETLTLCYTVLNPTPTISRTVPVTA
jgi:glycosyltransferase involved in cell wall biosynthesis